jgi:hypothetical protein
MGPGTADAGRHDPSAIEAATRIPIDPRMARSPARGGNGQPGRSPEGIDRSGGIDFLGAAPSDFTYARFTGGRLTNSIAGSRGEVVTGMINSSRILTPRSGGIGDSGMG